MAEELPKVTISIDNIGGPWTLARMQPMTPELLARLKDPQSMVGTRIVSPYGKLLVTKDGGRTIRALECRPVDRRTYQGWALE